MAFEKSYGFFIGRVSHCEAIDMPEKLEDTLDRKCKLCCCHEDDQKFALIFCSFPFKVDGCGVKRNVSFNSNVAVS